jgi:hypothetical protein
VDVMLMAVVRGVEDLTSVCWQKDNIFLFCYQRLSKIEKLREGDPFILTLSASQKFSCSQGKLGRMGEGRRKIRLIAG